MWAAAEADKHYRIPTDRAFGDKALIAASVHILDCTTDLTFILASLSSEKLQQAEELRRKTTEGWRTSDRGSPTTRLLNWHRKRRKARPRPVALR
ncbi:unnamed protein product [Victoria cruziana]